MRRNAIVIILICILFASVTPLDAIENNDQVGDPPAVDFGPNVLTHAQPYEYTGFSYFTATNTATLQWLNTIYSGLYRRGPVGYGLAVPDLADGMPIISDDGLTWTIHLKSGLVFSSGRMLTADDVVFSYLVHMTPLISQNNIYGTVVSWLGSNSSVVKIDDTTVEFTFTGRYSFLIDTILQVPIIDSHHFGAEYDLCLSGDLPACDWDDPNGYYAGGGAGQFYLHANSNSEIIVKKNTYYWNANNVWASDIVFKWEADKAIALNELDLGNIDTMDTLYKPTGADMMGLTGVNFLDYVRPVVQEISLNHLNPYYGTGAMIPGNGGVDNEDSRRDARLVRNAISRVIDKNYIINQIYSLDGIPAVSPIAPAVIGHSANPPLEPFDISLARSLMVQAGFDFSTLNYDGANDNYTTFFFNISLLTPNTSPDRVDWANFIEVELAKIGIGVTEHLIESWSVIIPRTFGWGGGSLVDVHDNGGYDAFFIGFSYGLEWDPGLQFSPTGLCDTGTCENFYNYANDTLGNKIQNMMETNSFDPNFQPLLAEIDQILVQEKPSIPLFHLRDYIGTRDDISGVQPLLMGYNAQNWGAIHKTSWADVAYPDYTPPSQVFGVFLDAQEEDYVRIGWEPADDNVIITNYRVYRNGELFANSSQTIFEDFSVSPGETHIYQIAAVDSSGNEGSWSLELVVVIPDYQPPSGISGFDFSFASDTSIALSWDSASDNVGVEYYNIYRDGALLVAVEDTSYTDRNLNPGITYRYVIRAVDAAGNEGVMSRELVIVLPPMSPFFRDFIVTPDNPTVDDEVEISVYYDYGGSIVEAILYYSYDGGENWKETRADERAMDWWSVTVSDLEAGEMQYYFTIRDEFERVTTSDIYTITISGDGTGIEPDVDLPFPFLYFTSALVSMVIIGRKYRNTRKL